MASQTSDSTSRSFPFWHPITRKRAAAAARAMNAPPPPSETYSGGCHCGALAFDVTLAPPLSEGLGHPVLECSCSICRHAGYLLVYPSRAHVVWRRGGVDKGPTLGVFPADGDGDGHGDDAPGSRGGTALGRYQFNTKAQDHIFCRNCGTNVMVDFRERWAPEFDGFGVNVRVLDGVQLDRMMRVPWDGLNRIPPSGQLNWRT